ncbi:MAG: amidohydrolase family protein, partial [Lachnospiraceae bacterium]|nr:amidohydrolase family protein [Lachnospiraceae bacterium]
MLLIRNVRVVDPFRGESKSDILIEQDKIIKMGSIQPADYVSVPLIEGDGLTAIPGLMDAHVHFRDPGFTWKEDLATGARSAAKGGVTSVVCMANTNPPVDTPAKL